MALALWTTCAHTHTAILALQKKEGNADWHKIFRWLLLGPLMHRSSELWWRIIVFPPQDSYCACCACALGGLPARFIAFVFVVAVVATVVVIFRATLNANLIWPKIIIINAVAVSTLALCGRLSSRRRFGRLATTVEHL